jgi:hypothetical protein
MSYQDSRACVHCGRLIDPLELCSCREARRRWYHSRTTLRGEQIERELDREDQRKAERERAVLL